MKRLVIFSAIIALGTTTFIQAKVFKASGSVKGRLNTAGLTWESAYQTTMNINGKRNELHVYAVHRNEPVVDQLREQFELQGANVSFAEGPDMAQGLARWADRETRMLILSSSGQPNQMVFLFYPEAGETLEKERLPIPDYPGALAVKTVSNEGTGTTTVSLQTEDLPDQVQAFYAGALSADGWRTVIPPSRGSKRMAIYQKKEQICTILSEHIPEGANRVTLLVKGSEL